MTKITELKKDNPPIFKSFVAPPKTDEVILLLNLVWDFEHWQNSKHKDISNKILLMISEKAKELASKDK